MRTTAAGNVIRFPAEQTGHPARGGATRLDIVRGRLRQLLGRAANWLRAPGAVQPTEIHDKVTGQHVAVTVGTLYVCLKVNGRAFYFDRLTGRFDGTGSTVP
jgi:hypothetical protein